MSYKAGIPLLHSFEDPSDDDDDEELTVETVIRPNRSCNRRHACFSLVLTATVLLVVGLIIVVVVPVVLIASKGGASCANGRDVCSSQFDTRQYKYIQLHNKLRVVLISDPESNVSAASMEVSAGSFSDPPTAQGLAHFCEHMLFLGTAKYPDEHEYSQFLTSHGGGDNAFTSTQNTNYYFSVQSDALSEALDRFAQFFVAPLFTSSLVQKEIHAVNAEHDKNIQSDGWRLWQLLKHVSNPDHPFSMFSTGNIGTLNHAGLLDQLHSYYTASYSANTMFLAVYGQDSIETLTNWTTSIFSSIPNRKLHPLSFMTTPFPREFAGKITHYYTVADQHTLSIFWQVAPLQSHTQSDPASFITRYLGYEGEGSILKYLQEHNLARSLSAGTEVDADSFTLLQVTVELTEHGLCQVSDVVRAVSQFVKVLAGSSDERVSTLWDDHLAVSQTVFDFGEQAEPGDYVQAISQNMRTAAQPADYLHSPSRFSLDLPLYRSTIAGLSPENSLVFIGSQRHNVPALNISTPPVNQSNVPENGRINWPDLTNQEPIYGTFYQSGDIPSTVADYWGQADDSLGLHLPTANTFVTESLELLPLDSVHTSSTPEKMDSSDTTGVALWWLQDAEFREKRVNLRCSIEAPLDTSDVETAAALRLYVTMVTYLLQPKLYPAREVGYDYTLSTSPRGVELEATGLSDARKMADFVQTLASGLVDHEQLSSNVLLFQLAYEEVTEELTTYNFTTLPYRYSYQYLQRVVLDRPYWKHWQLLSSLSSLNHSQVLDFVSQSLLSNTTLQCFVHGNLNLSLAVNYLRPLVSALRPGLTPDPTDVIGQFWREKVTLREPGNYSVVLPTLNPMDNNSVVNVVFQIGAVCERSDDSRCSHDSIIRRTHMSLLSQIIADECFYQLRTKQQLGYVVFCFPTYTEGMGSFQVVVQSQDYTADLVLTRIDAFLANYTSVLLSLTADEFGEQLDLLTENLMRRDDSFGDLTNRLWAEIVTGELQFDISQQIVNVLHGSFTVTRDSVAKFFEANLVAPDTYHKLVLAVYGTGKETQFQGNITHPLDYARLDQSSTVLP